jgi:hypothetical protein
VKERFVFRIIGVVSLLFVFTACQSAPRPEFWDEHAPYGYAIQKWEPRPPMTVSKGYTLKTILSNKDIRRVVNDRTVTVDSKLLHAPNGDLYFLGFKRQFSKHTKTGHDFWSGDRESVLYRWNEKEGLSVIDARIPMWRAHSVNIMNRDVYNCPKGSPLVFGMESVHMKLQKSSGNFRMTPVTPDMRVLCYGKDKKMRAVKQWVAQISPDHNLITANDFILGGDGKYEVYGTRSAPVIKYDLLGRKYNQPFNGGVRVIYRFEIPGTKGQIVADQHAISPPVFGPNWDITTFENGDMMGVKFRFGHLNYCKKVTPTIKKRIHHKAAHSICWQVGGKKDVIAGMLVLDDTTVLVGRLMGGKRKDRPRYPRIEKWTLAWEPAKLTRLFKGEWIQPVIKKREVIVANTGAVIGIVMRKGKLIFASSNANRRDLNGVYEISRVSGDWK